MANSISKFILIISSLLFILNTYYASAVSISTKRLYLTAKNNIATIFVVNEKVETERCQLSIRDTKIANNSIIQLLAEGEVAVNSPVKLIRFAPRRFDLAPNRHQNIKLSYRRRPGYEHGEYKGLFAIKCRTIMAGSTADSEEMAAIKPSLVLNVPVIVHTDDLKVSVAFKSVKLMEKHVEVSIKISGNRAITGDLEVVDKNSGEILASKKQMSIYWESPTKHVSLQLNKSVNSPLIIRFKEDPNFGGNLLIEHLVKSR
jgi:hypothetical protein